MADAYDAYLQGRQAGQQNRLNRLRIQQAEQQQPLQMRQQEAQTGLAEAKLSQLQSKEQIAAEQRKAQQDSNLLNVVLSQPPERQQEAFAQVANRLDPDTLQYFTDSTGRTVFDPNRAKMVQQMAQQFQSMPAEKITAEIANYRFEQKLPEDQRTSFRSWDRATVGEVEAKATAKERAKLKTQFKLKPQVAGAVTEAMEQSKLASKQAGEQKSNQTAFNVYEAGMKGLVEALGGTETGPFIGLIPAITANQQIAEGAVAAMAPILKQMFRAAGEGTFTDKDQELLLDMVPTRKDKPEARIAKISNIDAIIRAKLGQTEQPQQPAAPQTAPQQQMAQPQAQQETITLPNGVTVRRIR